MMKLNPAKTTATILTLLSVIVLSVTTAYSQLDPTFGTNGVATADVPGTENPLASAVLPDGKIFIVNETGNFSSEQYTFVRFESNGAPDATYGTNGVVQVTVPFASPPQAFINGAAIQPDGKAILVGRDSVNQGLIARYNHDGTLDATFAGGGVHRPDTSPLFRDGLYSVLVQPDGKILVAGYANQRLSLLRYLSNGTLDPSFGTGGTGFIFHNSIVIPMPWQGAEFFSLQSSGKILVGNSFESAGGSDPTRSRIYRFNTDGTIDSSFTVLDFPGSGSLKSAFVQPDDKILTGTLVSKTEALQITHVDSLISRYNSDGSPDAGFGTGGQTSIDINYLGNSSVGFQVMSDGQILVALKTNIVANRSRYRSFWMALARLSPSGTVNGKFLAAKGYDGDKAFISILPDGKVLTTFTTHTSGANIALLVARATGVPLENYIFHGVPYDFPWAPSGMAKVMFYRRDDGRWYFYPNTPGERFGLAEDIPVPSDYLGSINVGHGYFPEFAVFRPSNGTWYIGKNYSNFGTNYLAIPWGTSGDVPAPADYNGDGKSDIAVFRPSNGTWYIQYIADGSYVIQQFGVNGDKPVPGDYDGDGKYDIAVFRPSEGNWYIQRTSDGGYTILHFGSDGDIPVQEDYDGDGKFDIAVYRPSSGVWYRLNSSDGSVFYYQWGLPGDIPIPADYDGDLKTNIAVWRPSNGYWYIVNPDHVSMIYYIWGIPTDRPLPGRF